MIYVMSYSDIDRYPVSDKYTIVSCGSEMSGDYEVPLIMDNTGENRSHMNRTMCEWTGIYWLWRNAELPDYVGLCQQRRFFSFWDNVPNFGELLETNGKEFVLGNPFKMRINNYTQYSCYHIMKHIDELVRAVYRFDKSMAAPTAKFLFSDIIFPSNLCVMKRDRFVSMCEFVFGVMDEFMRGLGLKSMDDVEKYVMESNDEISKKGFHPNDTFEYQVRMWAYLAERLVNIYNFESIQDALVMNVVETSSKYGMNMFRMV